MKNMCEWCMHDKTCENKERETECGEYYYKPWYAEPRYWTSKTIACYMEYSHDVISDMADDVLLIIGRDATTKDAIAYVLALQDR